MTVNKHLCVIVFFDQFFFFDQLNECGSIVYKMFFVVVLHLSFDIFRTEVQFFHTLISIPLGIAGWYLELVVASMTPGNLCL